MKNIRSKNWNNEGKARITSLPATGRKPGKGRVRRRNTLAKLYG